MCYACFHLKPQKAEIDIWLKERKYCGKGYGTEALKLLCDYLKSNYSIKEFIIRPSVKNKHAIRDMKKLVLEKYKIMKKKIQLMNIYFQSF